MRQHLTPPNLVTSTSLCAGFAALLAAPAHLWATALLVMLAAVLDCVDGALARRRGDDHTFGAQLDSLTDLVCFCVVPAYALHETVLAGQPVVGLLVGCGFLLAGAWRLSRFPLVTQRGHFVGLPTPAAGLLVMLLALWAPVWPTVAATVVLGWLMTSTLRFPSLLSAVSVVRPRRRGHDPVRPARRRRGPLPRVLSRTRRPRNRSPVRQRTVGGAHRALRALRASGVRRRDRP